MWQTEEKNYGAMMADKEELWQRMGHRSLVSRRQCDQVIEENQTEALILQRPLRTVRCVAFDKGGNVDKEFQTEKVKKIQIQNQ